MGNALYDIKGMTYQGHLHQFWTADFKPDMKLFKKFRGYLLANSQINEVYYKKGREKKFIQELINNSTFTISENFEKQITSK